MSNHSITTNIRRQHLRRALSPRSIAFVGGGWVEAGIQYCQQLDYPGEIYVVNPKRDEIAGIRCVAEIADLPVIPDVAFVCVNKHLTIGIVETLRDFGVNAVVCNAAGFSEIGEAGASLQAELKKIRGDMLLFGPNSPGYVNFQTRAAVSMERFGLQPSGSGVAMVSQGGAMMMDIIASRLALTHMLCLGNQLDVSIAECIDVLLDDDNVEGIALYLEAMAVIDALSAVALRALKLGKPIVVLKSGASDSGSRAMFSHTASMTSPNQAVSAAFKRLGMVQVQSLPEMTETLKFLTVAGIPHGKRTAIVTASGMHSASTGDMAESVGLEVALPSEQSITAQKAVLPDIASAGNPLDLTTIYWGERNTQAACYRALIDDDFDIALSVVNYPCDGMWNLADWEQGFLGFVDVVKPLEIAAATISIFPESFPSEARTQHFEAGIAPLQGLRESMIAVVNAVDYGVNRERVLDLDENAVLLPAMDSSLDESASYALGEYQAKRALLSVGLMVPHGIEVSGDSFCKEQIDFPGPYALKLSDAAVSHKSELGAVVLDIADVDALTQAISDMQDDLLPYLVAKNFLVEQMVDDAIAELCVGVTWAAGVGLCLSLSSGGVLTELIGDTEVLLLPTSRQDVEQALKKLAVSRLIDGYRGKPAGDRSALLDALMTIADYANRQRHNLLELEINPLLIRPKGVAAADAILQFRQSGD